VAEWAKEGDPAARQFIAAAGEYLGVMLANLVNVLAPALVVVGGSLLDTWGSLLWAELERCLQEHALPQLLRQVEVVPARLGEDAALIGCAARVMQAVWESPEAAPERRVLGRAAAAQA
jgi:glucokinase